MQGGWIRDLTLHCITLHYLTLHYIALPWYSSMCTVYRSSSKCFTSYTFMQALWCSPPCVYCFQHYHDFQTISINVKYHVLSAVHKIHIYQSISWCMYTYYRSFKEGSGHIAHSSPTLLKGEWRTINVDMQCQFCLYEACNLECSQCSYSRHHFGTVLLTIDLATTLLYIEEHQSKASEVELTSLNCQLHVYACMEGVDCHSQLHILLIFQWRGSCSYLITQYTTYQVVEEATLYIPHTIFHKVLSRVRKCIQVGHSALTEKNVRSWHGRAAGGPYQLYTCTRTHMHAQTQSHTLHRQ